MRNEWNLLIDGDGIEIGDDIVVEDDEEGETIWKLCKYTNKFIWLRDKEGTICRFSTETLESEDGYKIIRGKA